MGDRTVVDVFEEVLQVPFEPKYIEDVDATTAYALAMRDWRAQVEQCKKGYQKVCDLPTPDPMKYM